ncbi:MAG TPA: antibiotic biosynthesis monooxygenase [Vicinamibacterales bacterium]|nr:antibiotic biosynthesis monooxygenase [Vicinamibacterales bacterium]
MTGLRAKGLGLLVALTLSTRAFAQAPADTTFYSVSYIEVKPSSRAVAIGTLKQYRDTVRRDPNNIRLELFEQADRPAHFVIVETWKTPMAFDAKAPQRKQVEDLMDSMRISGWDTRPYKTLTVASGTAEATSKSVYVISHVDVAPDPKIAGLLTALATASRLEDGNIRFDVLLHTMRSNHFEVIETWQSQRALDNHAAAVHTKKYRDDLQASLGSPLDERVYKVIE